MWTNKPVWLWLLEAFIERARPWVNWVAGLILLFYCFCCWFIGANLTWWAFTHLASPDNTWQVLESGFRVLIFPFIPIPNFCVIPYTCTTLLLLLNVKFSIGWRP